MQNNRDIGLKLLKRFETEDHSMIEDFHESTKLGTVPDPAFLKSVNAFLHVPSVRYLSARAWKEYAGFDRIALPQTSLGEMSLEKALAGRRSMTNVKRPIGPRINVAEMAAILQHSYGVTGELREKNDMFPTLPLRATCSAGGLYPLEIYPIVLNVDGLASGVYHYSVMDHSLEILRQENVSECFPDFASQQAICHTANVIFLITAVTRRTLSKYKHRGYRFIMNDAGALCQSLYLTSTAVGASCSTWGGFCDDQVGEYIGVDNVDEVVVLGFVVGAHSA